MNGKLLKAFFRKEEWAVRVVYDRYSRLLKHIAYEILRDNDLGDDVVNESFVRVLERGEIDGEKNFLAYLCRTAQNLALDMLRKEERVVHLEEEPAASIEKHDDTLSILRANLDKEEFDVLILHAVMGYPFKDIAAIFDCTPASARGVYHRCRQKAKKLLEGSL